GAAARQLEAGMGAHARVAQLCRRVGREGVRQRVLRDRVQAAPRGARRRGRDPRRQPRRRAARALRAALPRPRTDPHLRRRDERGTARDHRHGGSRHAEGTITMDFDFTQDQQALRDLARKILTDHSTDDRLKALKAAGEWHDRETWSALAQASLLGVAIPESLGGSGLGFLELGILCEEVGRTVAQVPVLASLVLGALPVAEFGSDAQKRASLPGVAAGTTVLTAALTELANDEPARPKTTATRRASGWTLDGAKVCVPSGDRAARILVPAATGPGTVGVFL